MNTENNKVPFGFDPDESIMQLIERIERHCPDNKIFLEFVDNLNTFFSRYCEAAGDDQELTFVYLVGQWVKSGQFEQWPAYYLRFELGTTVLGGYMFCLTADSCSILNIVVFSAEELESVSHLPKVKLN